MFLASQCGGEALPAEMRGGRHGVVLAKILQTPFSYGIFMEFSYIDICSFT